MKDITPLSMINSYIILKQKNNSLDEKKFMLHLY